MMMQPPYESLPPASKAITDYRHGGDQDSNPYNPETQRDEWEGYAWKMHELWHTDFKAEQRQLNQVINEENGNGKRNRS